MDVTEALDRLARWQSEQRLVHAILMDRSGSIASCIGHIIDIEGPKKLVEINATVGWGHLPPADKWGLLLDLKGARFSFLEWKTLEMNLRSVYREVVTVLLSSGSRCKLRAIKLPREIDRFPAN
jgi:hypothetical protein